MSHAENHAVNPIAFRTKNDRQSVNEQTYFERRRALLAEAPREALADVWPMYCSRQMLTWYMARMEIFKMALEVKGDIIECGAGWGGGTMLWAQLSSIFTPFFHNQRVTCFDTWGAHEGFTAIAPEDGEAYKDYSFVHDMEHLQEAIACYDLNRACPHIPKVRLVKGDACETIPQYLADNPYTVVKILSLDFDVLLPSRAALETFVPRMPKGAILVFDQVGSPLWAEGLAVLDVLGFRNLEIKCFSWEPAVSYARLI